MEGSVSKKRKREMEMERERDRISELPESVIHDILSFLPIRDAVATTILSKTWRNLWTTVPCLNVCQLSKYYMDGSKKSRNFVNQALLLWRGLGNLLKFKLDFEWEFFNFPLSRDVDAWVRFALQNNVQKLDIHIMIALKLEKLLIPQLRDECVYCAPLCLNSCSSITELSLVRCNLRIPVSPSWNQLKTLKIDGYWCFTETVVNLIMLGSPQLEVFELRFVESNDNLNVCSTRLKKLKIEKYILNEVDIAPSKDKWLRICCPNLEILAVSGVLYSKCLFTNVSSVTDVTLGLNGTYDYPHGNELVEETLKQVFSTFQHVHKATLSYWCVQVLCVLSSSLPNVEFFPNLKTLLIKDQTRDTEYEFDAGKPKYQKFETKLFDASKYLEFERKLSKSFMLRLKTVDITLVRGRKTSTFRFIEFLLKDACMLQELVIWVKRKKYYAQVAERLLYMPRSSPTARVILKKI